jgi:hypothetical protein
MKNLTRTTCRESALESLEAHQNIQDDAFTIEGLKSLKNSKITPLSALIIEFNVE